MSVAAAGDETAGNRDVDALLAANADRVRVLLDALRAGGAEVGASTPYDDVWALRFCLSHQDDAEAESCARRTLAWRAKKSEMLAHAAKGEPYPRFARLEKYVAADYHGETLARGPLYIIRAGISNPKAMMDDFSEEDVLDFMMYRKEIGFLKCDARTRSTRVLTKLVTVNDLNHVSLLSGPDKRFTAVLGKSSKLSEEYYPQLLDRAVLINVPYVFGAIWSLMKPLLSAKTRSKVAICGASDTRTGDVSKCPFAKLLNLDTVPSFLGGRCKCKGGCVGGCPNEQTVQVGKSDDDGMTRVTVAARDKLLVYRDVEPGDKVAWSVRVEAQGVEVTAYLRACGCDAGKPTTLVRKHKHKAEMGLKEEVLEMHQRGTLVFEFNNEYSLMNSKNVRYRAEVIEAAPSST